MRRLGSMVVVTVFVVVGLWAAPASAAPPRTTRSPARSRSGRFRFATDGFTDSVEDGTLPDEQVTLS